MKSTTFNTSDYLKSQTAVVAYLNVASEFLVSVSPG